MIDAISYMLPYFHFWKKDFPQKRLIGILDTQYYSDLIILCSNSTDYCLRS